MNAASVPPALTRLGIRTHGYDTPSGVAMPCQNTATFWSTTELLNAARELSARSDITKTDTKCANESYRVLTFNLLTANFVRLHKSTSV